MTDRKKWLEWRKGGIGGSDIGAIVGVNRYKTAFDVWADKLGMAVDRQNAAMRKGSVLEGMVAQMYSEDTGLALVEPDTVEMGIFRATGDRVCSDAPKRGWEIKSTTMRGVSSWGEPGTDDVPATYLMQCLWYAGLYGWDVVELLRTVLDDTDSTYDVFIVPANDRAFSNMQKVAFQFWQEHVLPRRPPLPDPDDVTAWASLSSSLSAAYKEELAEAIRATPELTAAAEAYDHARGEAKAWAEAKDAAKAKLQAALGHARGAHWPGGRVTLKASKPRRTTDYAKVANDFVDALDNALMQVDDDAAASLRSVFNPRGEFTRLVGQHTTSETTRRIDVRIKGAK